MTGTFVLRAVKRQGRLMYTPDIAYIQIGLCVGCLLPKYPLNSVYSQKIYCRND